MEKTKRVLATATTTAAMYAGPHETSATFKSFAQATTLLARLT